MQLSCSSPARKNNFLSAFLIRRDRARIFQVVAMKPQAEWRYQISNQITWRIDDRAGLLSHNDAGSLAQAVGHLLSYISDFFSEHRRVFLGSAGRWPAVRGSLPRTPVKCSGRSCALR